MCEFVLLVSVKVADHTSNCKLSIVMPCSENMVLLVRYIHVLIFPLA